MAVGRARAAETSARPFDGNSTAVLEVNLTAIQAVASLLGVEFAALGVRDAGEIERAITAFTRQPNGGLVVTTGALAQIHRELIISARHRLPTVYPYRPFVASGGLMCYAPQFVEQYRSATSYVDRILKGEKPADLPVQQPSKYDLVINLKTAKALGLTVPLTLLARADEVIE
jgi:putative ABC transport system substrate-binding protein